MARSSDRKLMTTVYMTAEQNAQLRRLAERTRVPVAVWVRDGVDLVLERARARGDLPAELPDSVRLRAAALD